MNIRIDPILIEQKSVLVQMGILMITGTRKEGIHSLSGWMENLQDWFWCVPAVNITICRTLII